LVCLRRRVILAPEGSYTPSLKTDRLPDHASPNRFPRSI
jgi:hypothetical protein